MYEDRVARGAELLDRVRPGWHREITADRLAMDSCNQCILGQIYGDYGRGLKILMRFDLEVFDRSERFGFEADSREGMPAAWWQGTFARLADAWRAAIRSRLEAESSVLV